jgi:hypothetical protein
MPQLDTVSFFSQYVWLCFFYFGFYLILVKYFLPRMSRLLKLRAKKIHGSQEGLSSFEQEVITLRGTRDGLLVDAVKHARGRLTDGFQATSLWAQEVVATTNANHFRALNEAYTTSVGTTASTHGLVLNDMKTVLGSLASGSSAGKDTEALFLAHLVDRLQKKPKK